MAYAFRSMGQSRQSGGVVTIAPYFEHCYGKHQWQEWRIGW